MTLRLRAAGAGDAEALAELGRQLNLQQRNPTEHYTAQAVARDVIDPGRAISAVLADLDGKPAGYASYHLGYEPAYAARGLYMVDLFVAPFARRRGVGRALVGELAAIAKEQNLVYLWWVVKAWNEEALAFYRALGAVEEPMVAQALIEGNFQRLAAAARAKN